MPRIKRNRIAKARKKDRTKELAYKIKIKHEIDKKGYVCGTIKDISQCLKIPVKDLKAIFKNSKDFVLDKIKGARREYYIIYSRKR